MNERYLVLLEYAILGVLLAVLLSQNVSSYGYDSQGTMHIGVWDLSDYGPIYQNYTVVFANLTNTSVPVADSSCVLSCNITGNWLFHSRLVYNSTLSLYQEKLDGGYRLGHGANLPFGDYYINVSCGGLSAVDHIDLRPFNTSLFLTASGRYNFSGESIVFYANFTGPIGEIGNTLGEVDLDSPVLSVSGFDCRRSGRIDCLIAGQGTGGAYSVSAYDGDLSLLFGLSESRGFSSYFIMPGDLDGDSFKNEFSLASYYAPYWFNESGRISPDRRETFPNTFTTIVDNIDSDSPDEVIFAGMHNDVIAFDADGSAIWNITGLDAAAKDLEMLGDGLLLLGLSYGSIYLVNASDGTVLWNTSDAGTRSMMTVDLDLSGKKDYVVVGQNLDDLAFFNRSGKNVLNLKLLGSSNLIDLAVADGDNDGYENEIATFIYGNITLLSCSLGGCSILWSRESFGSDRSIIFADVNNDAAPEIAAGGSGGIFVVYDINGNLIYAYNATAAIGESWSMDDSPAIESFDLNHDGSLDVAYGSDSGIVRIFQEAYCNLSYDSGEVIPMIWNHSLSLWQAKKSFPPGNHTIWVSCSKSGYHDAVASASISITQDVLAPEVNLTSPSGYASDALVKFNLFDFSKIDNATIYINSSGQFGPAQIMYNLSSGMHYFNLTVGEGAFVWNVFACDNSSNCAFASHNLSFILDSTAPSLSIFSPENDFFENTTKTITFNYAAFDRNGIANCTLNIGNYSYTSEGHSNFTVLLWNGNFSWNIVCYDPSGNINRSENRSFKILADAFPAVLLREPKQGHSDRDGIVFFVCNSSDDYSLYNVTLYGNWSGAWSPVETKRVTGRNNNTRFYQILAEGSYTWACMACDNSSRCSFSENRSFNVSYRTLFSHIKLGTINYANRYYSEPLNSTVLNWTVNHFDFVLDGPNTFYIDQDTFVVDYHTIIGTYENSYSFGTMPQLRDFAQKNNFSFEDILLHMKKNFIVDAGHSSMDMFGYYESPYAAMRRNGVLINRSKYVDVTQDAYNSGQETKINGTLFIGYELPFAIINFNLSKESQALDSAWQYWDGSGWSSLNVTDTTNSLSRNGSVRFIPPSDWKTISINGSRKKWWVRLRVFSAAAYPSAFRIYGDDWVASEVYFGIIRGPGVLLEQNGSYIDLTNISINNSLDFMLNGTLYLGMMGPFSELNINLSSPADNVTLTLEYYDRWEGWTQLGFSDTTKNLTQAGAIFFNQPANWYGRSINGTKKYWIRINISGDVYPHINYLTGPKGKSNLCRGWDPEDAGIVNKGLGELEYNPTPPLDAQANFRYQARGTGYWGSNYVFVNPGYQEGQQRPWIEFIAEDLVKSMFKKGALGSMADSLGGGFSTGVNMPSGQLTDIENYSDFIDCTNNSWENESVTSFAYLRDIVHAGLPYAKVGGNTHSRSFGMAGDYAYIEYAGAPRAIEASAYEYSSEHLHYDNFLPKNNPRGNFGVFMFQDVLNYAGLGGDSKPCFWDRSDRGPMAALSAYYIGMNNNTYLHYYTYGGWVYRDTDEVYYYSPNQTTLTENLYESQNNEQRYIIGKNFSLFPSSNYYIRIGEDVFFVNQKINDTALLTSQSVVYWNHSPGDEIRYISSRHMSMKEIPPLSEIFRWGNWFPAMEVDIGQPDPRGYNGGERDTSWSNGNYTLFRRDFTNAIVLYKDGNWDFNGDDYAQYLPQFDLNGTYYRLYADGTTGPAITSAAIRPGEGMILMKMPLSSIHAADADQDGCVRSMEIKAYTHRWAASSGRDTSDPVLITDMMEAIRLWKSRTGCS